MTNILFGKCTTELSGGGLYLSASGSVTLLTNVTFYNNTASISAGGMYLENLEEGITILEDCEFLANTVTDGTLNGQGGGLFVLGDRGLSTYNLVYQNNQAYQGVWNQKYKIFSQKQTNKRSSRDRIVHPIN
eukprot:TRINITY_DN3936_c0_g1_i1.p3 TRINITY_DN3936_c0_g1~~TRINITY_DN3936_c0_g1_i1.p3  ORF type:complete len:132 (+),score=17.16 TRINITY_DN3936_c0_g1_i1:533-928(+)